MRARVSVAVAVLVVLAAVGLFLSWIVARRHDAARVGCLNNMRVHAQAAGDVFDLLGKLPKELKNRAIPGAVPAGTVFVPGRPPDQRLSWIAAELGGMSQSPQPTTLLAGRLDRAATWDAGPNAEVGRTRLKLFTCPANVPETPAESPAVTQYVGLSGVGKDAAELPLGVFVSPRAGCFRYDAPTPLDVIHQRDGLDTTLLFAEVSTDLGPWIRGGPSTVRGYEDGAAPPIGFGGQFGGNHPNGVAAVAYASGAAKFLTARISPNVFRAMVTIAGGADEMLPPGD